MTQIERDNAFRVKLGEFAVITKELHDLAKLSYEYESPYMNSRFGTNGDIFNDIKELCHHYDVEF